MSKDNKKLKRRCYIRFNDRFQQLQSFHKRHGHCEVPRNTSLGKWCYNLRREQLTDVQRQLLDSPQFQFCYRSRHDTWLRRLKQYQTYNILTHKEKQSVKKWAYHQREQKDKGLLPEDKLDMLNKAGFRWERGTINFLCLGMSYAKLCRGKSFEDICRMTQNGDLNPMDGRDGARLRLLEEKYHCRAYTVSKQTSAEYDVTRHLYLNFNRSKFFNNELWGTACDNGSPRFKQVRLPADDPILLIYR